MSKRKYTSFAMQWVVCSCERCYICNEVANYRNQKTNDAICNWCAHDPNMIFNFDDYEDGIPDGWIPTLMCTCCTNKFEKYKKSLNKKIKQ